MADPQPPYNSLSFAEKREVAAAAVREPTVACPSDCGTQLQPGDLLQHAAERCPGPRDPTRATVMIDRQQAMRAGVRPSTLSKWARSAKVRYLGARLDRKYVLRDVALQIVKQRMEERRRMATIVANKRRPR